jgi:uncharacterized membrane protein YkoI
MTAKLKRVLITVAALAALALGGAAIAGAASGGESEAGDTSKPIAGDAKAQAETAALAATGGGKVNQTELDNENGATYEVEVAKTDGSQVDVRLDDNFKVIAAESDGDKGDGHNEGADQNPGEHGHQGEKAGEPDHESTGETADDAAR